MEDLKISIEGGPDILASVTDVDFVGEVSLSVGWDVTYITKDQAKHLGLWLIQSSQ